MGATDITLRAIKGSALTHNEMDDNFNNLNTVGTYVGMIFMWPTASVPDSTFLPCEGGSYAVASYPDLFGVIGYTYGGSGANFNVPDYRGYVPRGWDHGAGNDPNAGARTNRGDGTTGDNVGTKQLDDYKAHKHMINFISGFGNDKYGIAPDSGAGTFNVATEGGSGTVYSSQMPASGGDETRMKNVGILFIIKARNT